MENLWEKGQLLARIFMVKLTNIIYRWWEKDVPVSVWKPFDGVVENSQKIKRIL